MSKLETRSLTDRVRELIRREIEEGRLLPGTRIIEDELARELGISKTPLRLAIHLLRQDGLVHVEPRQGIYVKQHSVDETLELIEIRAVLEGLAARRIALNADLAAARRLRDCLAGCGTTPLAGGSPDYVAIDRAFHRMLAVEARSSELEKSLQMIFARLGMHRLRSAAMTRVGEGAVYPELVAIVDAIEAGNADVAERLAAAHVRNIPWAAIFAENDLVTIGGETPTLLSGNSGRVVEPAV